MAWFHYELLVVSAPWSLLAVEAALGDRLATGPQAMLKTLVEQAVAKGLLEPSWEPRLDAGRRLRNQLLHAGEQVTWTPGMAAPVVAAAHKAVTDLYPD